MRMCLPTGKLATTDKENAEVFGPHFEKVFSKHRPIEWNVINKIKQRQTMHELNEPITWAELKTEIEKLVNDKAPGLNKVPPNASSCLAIKILYIYLSSSTTNGKKRPPSQNDTKGNSYQYQKAATSPTQTTGAE